MYPHPIKKLIKIFSEFPGIGERVATRFAFHLLREKEQNLKELIKAILELKKIKTCSFCFNIFEGEGKICPICSDQKRQKNVVLVVEKETDLVTIEKTKIYKGLYFVFGGKITFKKEEDKKLRIEELKERIKNPKKFGIKTEKIDEVIIGTDFTTEGEATALYLKENLKDLDIKISRLAKGLPTGGEIEYADEETLSWALRMKKEEKL
jgi:recombination protein RecR